MYVVHKVIITFLMCFLFTTPFCQNIAGQMTEVTSDFHYEGTIKDGNIEVYFFPGNDLYIELLVSTDKVVDFYIFTSTGYDDFIDITEQYFYPEEKAEKRTSFRWSEKASQDYYLIIDNDYISESGAIPNGTISYEITVGLDVVRPLNPFQEQLFIFIVVVCVILIIIIVWHFRSPKKVEIPPPPIIDQYTCPICGSIIEKGRNCPICQSNERG